MDNNPLDCLLIVSVYKITKIIDYTLSKTNYNNLFFLYQNNPLKIDLFFLNF